MQRSELPDADRRLLERFEATTISPDEWTHCAHLTVAYAYLRTCTFDDACAQMRSGIRRLNAVLEIPEAIDRGYHETLTMAWLRVLASVMRARGVEASADAFLDRHPYLRERFLLRLFYTTDRIMTEEAKATYVEPDIVSFRLAFDT